MRDLSVLQEFYSLVENIQHTLKTAEDVVDNLVDYRDLSPESRKKGAEFLERLTFDLRVKAEVANALLQDKEWKGNFKDDED